MAMSGFDLSLFTRACLVSDRKPVGLDLAGEHPRQIARRFAALGSKMKCAILENRSTTTAHNWSHSSDSSKSVMKSMAKSLVRSSTNSEHSFQKFLLVMKLLIGISGKLMLAVGRILKGICPSRVGGCRLVVRRFGVGW
jgi:hypothetical protein